MQRSVLDSVSPESSGYQSSQADVWSGEPDHFYSGDSFLRHNKHFGSGTNDKESSSVFTRQIGMFSGDDDFLGLGDGLSGPDDNPIGSGDEPFGSGHGHFGSGNDHFDPFPFYIYCDYWNFVDNDDYLAFQDKYSVYNGGQNLVEKIMPEVETWKTGYNDLIEAIFDGSYIDVDNFPEHAECIEALDVFDVHFNNTIRNLGNNAERFFTCYDRYCSSAGPNLVNDIISFPIQNVEKSKAALNKCNWVYDIWSRETGFGRYSDVESALATVNQHNNNIKQSFKNFVKGTEALPAQLQTSLAPLEETLKLYLEYNITKAALATSFTSRTVDNAVTEILDLQNKIRNILNELVSSVDSMWTTLASLYETILDRDIPLVKPSEILELECRSLVTELNRTKRHLFLNTWNIDDAKYIDVVIETLDLIFENYSSIFHDIHEKQVHVVIDLVTQIDDLSDELNNYLAALKMDKDFIM